MSNIKDIRIAVVPFVTSPFIKDRLRYKEMRGMFSAAWLVMGFLVEKKSPVQFVPSPSCLALIRKRVAGLAQISTGLVLNIKSIGQEARYFLKEL